MDDKKNEVLTEDTMNPKFREAIAAAFPDENSTDDFKEDIQKATEQMAAEVAAWKEFWKVWMPGGLRKRKRYRTEGHGLRRTTRRKRNKVARASRKQNRPAKKRRSR